jgi:CheY-like chemotaxis protein
VLPLSPFDILHPNFLIMPLPKKKILIVEDDTFMVFMLQLCYEPLGFEIADCVDTAEAAIEFMTTHKDISLISMDITLCTSKTGLDAARAIRALGIEIPIVFISGSIEHIPATQTISNSYFLEKPVILEDITVMVNKIFVS